MKNKIDHIFTCAMELLRESGNQGFSMRKVSAKAGMSLSNLQYYFKTKELLLAGLLKGFLECYTESFQEYDWSKGKHPKENLNQLLLHIFNDEGFDDCGTIFKELWAIAERNPGVKLAMTEYYQGLYQILFGMIEEIAPPKCREKSIHYSVSLLLPFIEGYCITRSVLPVSPDDLAEQFTEVITMILKQNGT